jgi:hypothetical protein
MPKTVFTTDLTIADQVQPGLFSDVRSHACLYGTVVLRSYVCMHGRLYLPHAVQFGLILDGTGQCVRLHCLNPHECYVQSGFVSVLLFLPAASS